MIFYLITVVFFSVFSTFTMDQMDASSATNSPIPPRKIVALTPDQWKRIFLQMVEEVNVKSVEKLLNSIPEELEDYIAQNSWKLISYAINNNNPELLSLLIKAGANVEDQSLVYPHIQPNYEIINTFLTAGVTPKDSDLLEAVRWGNKNIVARLLQTGIGTNIQTRDLKNTLLSEAIRKKYYQIALLLLSAGIQPERTDNLEILNPYQMLKASVNNFELFKHLALFLNRQERSQALLLELRPLEREFLERIFREFPDPKALKFLAFRELALTKRGLADIDEISGFNSEQRILLSEFR